MFFLVKSILTFEFSDPVHAACFSSHSCNIWVVWQCMFFVCLFVYFVFDQLVKKHNRGGSPAAYRKVQLVWSKTTSPFIVRWHRTERHTLLQEASTTRMALYNKHKCTYACVCPPPPRTHTLPPLSPHPHATECRKNNNNKTLGQESCCYFVTYVGFYKTHVNKLESRLSHILDYRL